MLILVYAFADISDPNKPKYFSVSSNKECRKLDPSSIITLKYFV